MPKFTPGFPLCLEWLTGLSSEQGGTDHIRSLKPKLKSQNILHTLLPPSAIAGVMRSLLLLLLRRHSSEAESIVNPDPDRFDVFLWCYLDVV